MEELTRLHARSFDKYRGQPAAAHTLAEGGIAAGPRANQVGVAEMAAWVTVANVLLNLDETLMKY